MGLFCVNLHFRAADDQALAAALIRRGVGRYRVLPAKGGWTSLYEEGASEQDEQRIRQLAGGLSRDLHVAAIAFLVHDSDLACYWLFDDGRLLDDYNSCPGYFDDDDDGGEEPPSARWGRPDLLLPYCKTGVQIEDLSAILTEEQVFAENVIERLAAALGIDRQRALADYRDLSGGHRPGGTIPPDDDDDDDGGRGRTGASPRSAKAAVAGRLAKMLGLGAQADAADPQVAALVQASARDDIAEVDRLLAGGVAINAEAPAPIPGAQPLAGLAQLFPGRSPQIAMTPLLAAIVNKRHRAAQRLLEAGADPNRVHPLFGTAVHAAAGAGEAELLQLMLDHGGDRKARNLQGQTPMQVIAAGRASRDRLAHAEMMIKSLGMKIPGLGGQLANVSLPIEGWDTCERLLNEL